MSFTSTLRCRGLNRQESCVGPRANDTTFRVRASEVGDLGNGRRWGPDSDQWVTSVEDHRGGPPVTFQNVKISLN